MPKERWLPIRGFEGFYSVSDLGRIRRDARGPRTRPGKILASPPTKWGYKSPVLSACGRRRRIVVHVEVALAFLGPRPAGMQINHINGVKADNRAANLEYVTRKENRDHAVRLGLLNISGDAHWTRRHPERLLRGEAHPNHVVTDEMRRGMRAMRANGEAFHTIAARFGVGVRTAWRHAHLTEE